MSWGYRPDYDAFENYIGPYCNNSSLLGICLGIYDGLPNPKAEFFADGLLTLLPTIKDLHRQIYRPFVLWMLKETLPRSTPNSFVHSETCNVIELFERYDSVTNREWGDAYNNTFFPALGPRELAEAEWIGPEHRYPFTFGGVYQCADCISYRYPNKGYSQRLTETYIRFRDKFLQLATIHLN